MESQVTDEVAHVPRNETWPDLLFAALRPADRHVSDEEIYEILNVDTDHDAAAELFAAKGVTVPKYCLWKAKFRNLTVEQIGEVRRGELGRSRRTVAVLAAIVLLGGGGLAITLTRVALHTILIPADARASTAVPAASDSAANPPWSDRRPAASVPATAKSAPATAESGPVVLPAVTETGYRIQVAAANTLQEGRALVERLASAGYAAYLLQANVNGAEVFRVRVGPFDNLDLARDAASQLRRDGYPAAWIAR